jgi:hypothetical protein
MMDVQTMGSWRQCWKAASIHSIQPAVHSQALALCVAWKFQVCEASGCGVDGVVKCCFARLWRSCRLKGIVETWL